MNTIADRRIQTSAETDPLASIARTSSHPRIAHRVLELVLWELGYPQTDLPFGFGLNTNLDGMGMDDLTMSEILFELSIEFAFAELEPSEANLNSHTPNDFIALVRRESPCQNP